MFYSSHLISNDKKITDLRCMVKDNREEAEKIREDRLCCKGYRNTADPETGDQCRDFYSDIIEKQNEDNHPDQDFYYSGYQVNGKIITLGRFFVFPMFV